MKYIKKYESINNEPQIGDYVICKEEEETPGFTDIINWTSVNIGKCVRIDQHKYPYLIQYENIPNNIKNNFLHRNVPNCRMMRKYEIIHWSPNKEDLEIYTNAIKYNL